MQFERRTEASVIARSRASSDPTPAKCPNKGGQPPAEGMEGRQPTKENIGPATAPRTQSRIGELSGLLGVREALALRRQVSEVGAVCSNSARTDLCGVVSRTRSSERDAVSEMEEDPSEPAYRRRLQTAVSCCRPMAVVVNVTEKA